MPLNLSCGSETVPPVCVGTGYIALTPVGGGTSINFGNVTVVDFSASGETFAAFTPGATKLSAVAIHREWRLKLSGDEFTAENLGLIMNGMVGDAGFGESVTMPWISEPRLFSAIFVRPGTNWMPTLTLYFYRCYVDIDFSYTMSQDEFSYQEIDLVALPDPTQDSESPFGYAIHQAAVEE